jgi:hypothetical protein
MSAAAIAARVGGPTYFIGNVLGTGGALSAMPRGVPDVVLDADEHPATKITATARTPDEIRFTSNS